MRPVRTAEPVTAEVAAQKAAVLHFIDNAGVARIKCVPAHRLEQLAGSGVGMSPIFGVLTTDDTHAAVPGLDACQGDLRLRPDLAAVRPLPGRPGWIWAPADQYSQEGDPWAGCQRDFLRRMLAAASARGLTFLSAFELEWNAGWAEESGWRPLHSGPSHGAVLFPALQAHFDALFEDLAFAGIDVEHAHAEYGAGQLETALGPTDPMVACDVAALARQIIHSRSAADGWQASFAPLASGPIGNGAHTHISAWRDGRNLFAPDAHHVRMDPEGAAFLAGVLAELPALTAIGSPLRESYTRLRPGAWSGGWACWGVENREAALRLEGCAGPNAPRSSNLEWKAVDGAANPYLAMGALIAAGLRGIEAGLDLPEPVEGDPANLDPDLRAAVAPRLPGDIDAATDALEDSRTLRDALGDLLLDSIIATRRLEASGTAELSHDQLRTRSQRRY